MRFCLALLFAGVAHLVHAQETALSPACTAELTWLKGAAQTLAVAIEAPPGLRVGDKLHVKWSGGQGLAGKLPVALILAMPDSVRFEGRYVSEQEKDKDGEVLQDGTYGPDFLAFPPRSVDPFGLKHANDRLRAVVPLHSSGPRAGELWIKPLRAQPLDIQWALVASTACGERLIRSGEAVRLSVGLGRPQIVVQDAMVSLGSRSKGSAAAADEKPSKVIASGTGQYILHEYKHSYRVFEADSGALLLDGPGYAPGFSPTSRFLAARTGGASDSQSQVEIFDLLAGQQIALVTAPILGWSHADALIYAGHTEMRTLNIGASLIDEFDDKGPTNGLLFQGVSGTGREMDAWNYLNFLVRADQGIVAFKSQGLSERPGILSLYDGRVAELDGAAQWTAALGRDYGIDAGDALVGWQSSPPIGLTHMCASCDRDDTRRSVKRYSDNNRSRPVQKSALVQRNEVAKVSAGSSTRTAPGVERSVWKRTGSPDGAVADDVEARLEEFGLPLGPHTILASGTFDRWDVGGLDYARKWPAEVASRLQRELGFHTGFIVGHWTIPHQGKVVHIVQNGRFPEMGWEYPFVEMATFDERGGRLSNLRRHHVLNGVNAVGAPAAVQKHWAAQKIALRVTDLGNGTVALGWPATNTIGLLSLGDGSLEVIREAPQSDLMRFNALTRDHRHLVQVNQDGRFFVYRVGSGKRVLSGRAIDGEFIVHDENGYYAATYEGAHFVHMRFPGEAGVHSFHQFASRLHRPDLIAKVVADDAAEVPGPALTTPPTVGLALRRSPGGRVAAVQARAGEALKSIRLYQDGQLTQEVEAAGRDVALDINLARIGRARWVTAVAVDRSGMLSRPATAQLDDPGDAPGGALLGVTVGVDRHHDARTFPRLDLAVKDARDMAAVLKDKRSSSYYGRVEVQSLTDNQATPEGVLAAVKDAVSRAKAGDTVVFFYAGHGVRGRDGRYYLASPAASLADLAGTAIAWADVAKVLQRSRARVVVYLDACHSALAGEAFASNDDAVAQIMSGAQAPMLVLAASKGRQFGEEMQGLGNGVFTHAVRRVLRADRGRYDTNRNGLIELSELYDGVRSIVAGLTKGRQTPWLVRSDLIGDFAVH